MEILEPRELPERVELWGSNGVVVESMFAVPINRTAKTFFKERVRGEPQQSFRFADVQSSSWLAIRLGGIPNYFTLETCQADDDCDQITNSNLHPRTQVHRSTTVVSLGSNHNPFGRVSDVQEFSCCLPCTPNGDVRITIRLCVQTLANECRNDMRGFKVEIVPRAVEVYWDKKDRVEAVLLAIGL